MAFDGFGSINNYLMSGSNGAPEPQVNMGCTILMYTDRHPTTIVRVSTNKKTIWIKKDKATRLDKNGMNESQEYSFECDDTAPEERFNLNKRGQYGQTKNGMRLRIGERDKYHDFSF